MSAVQPLHGDVRDVRDPYAPSADDRARAQRLHAAWDAYHGRFHGGDPQWPLLWKSGKEPSPNVIINRCGPAADTDVSWLFGESVSITLKKCPRAAQQYVDQVWGVSSDESSDDDKMALLQELATNGAVTGHAYLKINWDAARMDYPRLVVLDSSQVRVVCDPHDIKTAVCYIVEYQVPDTTSRSGGHGNGLATYRQVLELCDADGEPTMDGSCMGDKGATWRICDYLKAANSAVFQPQGEPVVWPYPWAPIDGCPHMVQANHFYGRPRLTPDVIHINEAICTVASNINKIGMRHGHPILYTIKKGSTQRSLRHEPGTIMEVSDDVKAVEAHGDLQHLMDFEEDLRADFDEETHVPAQAFGRQQDIPRTPVSGVAIRLGYGPLMADVTKERRTYGALIRRVTQHLLQLKNEAWADALVTLGWQDPLPADDLQQAQVVQSYVQMGVMSKSTAAEKGGLDWDVEQEQMRAEAMAALDNMLRGQALPPPPPAQPQGQQSAANEAAGNQQQQSAQEPSLGSASATAPSQQANQTNQSRARRVPGAPRAG